MAAFKLRETAVMETPEVLLWSRVDVIGPDGSEVLGRLDAYSAADSGRWAWFCSACATSSAVLWL